MVNPLARVVMNNVVKNCGCSNSDVEDKKIVNLTSKDDKIIRDIINKNMKVKNHSEIGKKITLDEAVEMIKDGR